MLLIISLVIVYAACLNGLKLRQSDLWDHVNYGRIILDTGGMPKTEPLLPLASPEPFINPAWGSQVLMALCIDTKVLGLAGMQTAHGLLALFCIAIIGIAVSNKSGSAVFATAAALIYLYVNWQQFLVVRPQTLGVLFFTALFAALNLKLHQRRFHQLLIVLCFIVWSNLHGSFTMGLFLIGITGIGRLIDFGLRYTRLYRNKPEAFHQQPSKTTWQLAAGMLNRSGFTNLLILGVSCAIAVMVNPFGISVYDEVLRVGSHSNMQNMNEWKPLNLSMKQGQAAAWAFGLLICSCVLSKRRLQAHNVLLLAILGGLMLWSARMINWWAPVTAYLFGIHATSAASHFRLPAIIRRQPHLRSPKHWKVTAVCGLAATITIFSISTLGRQTFGQSFTETELLESRTPLNLAEFLCGDQNKNQQAKSSINPLLDSLVFCPAEWTGYLMSTTRQTKKLHSSRQKIQFPFRPMVSTHVHVIPPPVWNDFLRLHYGRPNSLSTLNRYRIDTVIIDRSRQRKLAEQIEASGLFDMIYQDERGQVWRRVST